MKKSILLIAALYLLLTGPANSQSRLLKRVANDVAGELLGPSGSKTRNTQPEPPSACNNAELIFDLGSKKLVYSEVGIDVLDDGSILIKNETWCYCCVVLVQEEHSLCSKSDQNL